MRRRLPEIRAFADGVRADGFTDAVLCGMGGSSLCAEVLRDVLGPLPGGLRLHVLDTTDPEAIRTVERSLDVRRTLFLVASKSGTTVETDCLFRHFFGRVAAAGVPRAGAHFVAITDPGSSLLDVAATHGFRAAFENPSDIGGRYSATSLFGLVPAALLGADLGALCDAAAEAARRNGPAAEPHDAAGLQFGALMGALALAGADKLTLRTSSRLASFGAWAEQLIAESTGKEGRGVLPVVDEPPGCHHGDDRLHVDLALVGDTSPPAGPRPEAIVVAGAPEQVASLFFQFEMATAVAGAVLGVNPFDEPNVAEAKAATNAVLAGTGVAPQVTVGKAPQFELRAPATTGGPCPFTLLGSARPGDYVAILAYVARTDRRHALLQEIRALASRRARAAATLGYGPRYLHSTGQLHKGGAANGIFLLFTQEVSRDDDLPVPGKPFTFGRLFAAQGEGDLRTLAARGRRVLEVRLARPLDEALAAFRDALGDGAPS